jgi:hypothetical protein
VGQWQRVHGQSNIARNQFRHRFAQSLTDNIELLLPLIQCCTIRPSTVHSLLELYVGEQSLSQAMRGYRMCTQRLSLFVIFSSMRDDPLYPVLQPKHYRALDRRLVDVIRAIYTCMRNAHNISDVVRVRYDHPDVPFTSHDQQNMEDCLSP